VLPSRSNVRSASGSRLRFGQEFKSVRIVIVTEFEFEFELRNLTRADMPRAGGVHYYYIY